MSPASAMPTSSSLNNPPPSVSEVHEKHVTLDGEPYVCITNVDALPAFLVSIVSSGDFWLFAGSNSPFTAGRINPDGGLFPYQTVDKILQHADSSGSISLFQVLRDGAWSLWEPWTPGVRVHRVTRNLYKHVLGTDVVFEEINHDLGLRFIWRLSISDRYGLVRYACLENLTKQALEVRYLDGLNQMIPPGLNHQTYAAFSNLGAAYMRHECIEERALAIYTMNSGFTDRAEPCESLRAGVAWSIGHNDAKVLLSARQLDLFRFGGEPVAEQEVRGDFGGYFVNATTKLATNGKHDWYMVADTRLDHPALVELESELRDPCAIKEALLESVKENRRALRRKIANADGLQQTAQRTTCVHHFANTLFNCMRGGTLENSYRVPSSDLADFLRARNTELCKRHQGWLDSLPAEFSLQELYARAAATDDVQFRRLAREYLPLTFSRRHGDPSRPWNYFSISVKDVNGKPIYAYQGNWRDIFQNWEALAQSYPACIQAMIAVFLNASTADGYNPLHVSREGIAWDTWEPENPWSHFGYWGDHQIIYLLRLLETCERFHPGVLAEGLESKLFSYAQVPYEIKDFDDLVLDPRNSMTFDGALHKKLMARAAKIGNDGKLTADGNGDVLLISLAEKLLVPLLSKLSNLVPEGGIWMNTQRPEWNDGNNALAGWGLSMVTVYHLRRYLVFLDRLFSQSTAEAVNVSAPLATFTSAITNILRGLVSGMEEQRDTSARFGIMAALGKAGEQYRAAVYQEKLEEQTSLSLAAVHALISTAIAAVDETIRANRREDGMYHSYNTLVISGEEASVKHLTLMLEGQVALLGSGFLSAPDTLALLKAMRASTLYRADQNSYMLNPDREIAPFLLRNSLPSTAVKTAPMLAELVAASERSVVVADKNEILHFQADLRNASDLIKRLDSLAGQEKWKASVERDRQAILDIWERVFVHSEFTGRSGTMFAFEGLGSIYWHMVAKLLLAVQESYHQAMASDPNALYVPQLADAYYEARSGLGFTKSPAEYGAFPTDPYSHTPRNRGAQQPGMTGQVKEEVLTRLGELGVSVEGGRIQFSPTLLRRDEFTTDSHSFAYIDINGLDQDWLLPPQSLAFTFCQTPVAYVLTESANGEAANFSIIIERKGATANPISGNSLSCAESQDIFNRTGEITKIIVHVPSGAVTL
ncbi:MAG: hypothetical protein ACFUZC_08785 [Chthoniobacteraceae bacterium]